MTIIYFVRHGRTDWNHKGLYRGHADRSLDDIGNRQAELVRDGLKNLGIQELLASPMQRTFQTFAKISAYLKHRPIVAVNELKDINYGQWQGKSKEEVSEIWPELVQQWREDPFSVTFPDGESLKAVQERAMVGLKKILQYYPDKTVAVCSHRVVLKALFCGMVGATSPQAFYSFKMDPASFSIVRFHGDTPIFVTLNDTRHIRNNPLEGPEDF